MTLWRDASARLGSQGARRWYWGSIWGVAYLAIPVSIVWFNATADVTVPVLATILVVVVAAVYVVIPPLIWGRGPRTAALTMLGFLALTCLAFPLIGLDTIWLWIYVPIMASMSWQNRAFSLGAVGVVVIGQLAVVSAAGHFDDYWYAAALTASIGVMMFAFAQQIQAITRLRAAQSEVARLAVVDERARFSRDMHDVLGHSLTVVTVKSELARRLVSIDASRAEQEIADVERLTRAALADLRAAVAGYRGMNLSTELAVAQASLAAADIEAHLPENAGVAAPELREVFGWVLREGVTNVIRHSGARNCWVELTRDSLAVCDDGRGMASTDRTAGAATGSGLRGLSERADAAGAVLQVDAGPHGGVRLSVEARR
jgi:two-component system sensor histidine kinase DesK